MAHSYTGIYYHLIFHTKSNDVLIPKVLFDDLFAYIGGIIRKDNGILHEAGGMPDHIHLLLTIHRSVSIADAVRAIKARSSLWLSKQGIQDFKLAEWIRHFQRELKHCTSRKKIHPKSRIPSSNSKRQR